MKSLATVRKRFKKFQEIYQEGLWWQDLEEKIDYKRLCKGEGGEQAAVDQRHLSAKVFSTDIVFEVEMKGGRVSENSLRSLACRLKQFTLLFTESKALQEVSPDWQTRRWWRSEWEHVRWSWWWLPQLLDHLRQHSHCWWVSGGWRRNWPASFSPRSPSRGSWRGVVKFHCEELRRGTLVVIWVLREVREDRRQRHWENHPGYKDHTPYI